MSQLNLPDTGVTVCYDNAGKDITTPKHDEPFYGQDGCFEVHPMSFQKLDRTGKPLPSTADWEDGHRMTLDNNTGLMWEVKSPVGEDINYQNDMYSWEDAPKTFLNTLNKNKYGGFSDWRMPNKDELRSIFNYSIVNPSVDTCFFPNTKVDFYWTKNTYEMQPYLGWVLFAGLGSATACGKTVNQYVRAVRGGNNAKFGEPDVSRFVDNGDGTITDTVTRLMWQKGENERTNWFTALEKCRDMRLAGLSDWRLPNIKELNTILNLNYTDGWWYFKDMFPAEGLQPPLLHYYSSTPYEKFYAWVTNFCFGYDGYYASKMAPLLFRAVRNLDTPASESQKIFRMADSGQRECYNDEGRIIKAPKKGEPFFGQDGTIEIIPLSGKRLRAGGFATEDHASWDEGFRMVLDNNTGLMWEVKSPVEQDLNYAGNKHTWQQASDYVSRMNDIAYGGFADWRMPNREELRSIVDYGKYSPSLLESFGSDCPPEFFWSCDPYGPNPDLMWGIYFALGCGICYPKDNRYAIRVVRGGYNPAFGDTKLRSMKDNGDGTISDVNSGLMWMKDETPELNWNDAMAHCQNLTLAGHNDWRLPSIREIGTLIDISFKDQCWFDKDAFPGTKTKPLGFYWASSTYAATFGWGVNFQFGYDGYYAGKKTGKYPFRPVRFIK